MKNKTRLSVLVLVLAVGAFLAACGPLPAGAEVSVNQDGQSATVEFAGTVDSIAADQWVIQGQVILIDSASVIDAGIVTGDLVKVKATITADGKVTANRIEVYTPPATATPGAGDASGVTGADPSATPVAGDEAEFVGIVETISPEAWTVTGQVFIVNTQTEIKNTIVAGDTVKVHAIVGADGSLTAREIELFDPLANGGQASGLTGDEMELTGIADAIAADQWTVSGFSFVVTLQTEIKDAIVVGDRVKVHLLLGADGLLTAREIELADADDTSGPALGLELEMTGVVEAVSADSLTVGGRTFILTAQTEMDGVLAVGETVKVEAFGNLDGILTAREVKHISLLGNSGSSGSGDGSNASSSGSSDDDSGRHGDDDDEDDDDD